MDQDNLRDQLFDSENQKLLSDLNECHKHMVFLQKYRKIASDLTQNCICDQNKDMKSLFDSIESLFKRISNENDKSMSSSSDETVGHEMVITREVDKPKDVLDSSHLRSKVTPNDPVFKL